MKEINKKRSRSFCMCFDQADMGKALGLGAEERSEGVRPVPSPAAKMSLNDDVDKDVDSSFGRENKVGRRSFSRYVKAVLFETSLMMRRRNKRIGQKLYRTYNNVKSKPKNIFHPKSINNDNNISSSVNQKSMDHHDEDPSTTSWAYSSSLCTTSGNTNSSSSSTTTTSRCSSSLSLSERLEKSSMQGKVGKGCFGVNNVGICLLLVSLFVLVMWGKLCAIFCTSTWLFFAIHWSTIKLSPPAGNSVNNFPDNFDTDKYYKKRIIMEGLLERKHSRNRY